MLSLLVLLRALSAWCPSSPCKWPSLVYVDFPSFRPPARALGLVSPPAQVPRGGRLSQQEVTGHSDGLPGLGAWLQRGNISRAPVLVRFGGHQLTECGDWLIRHIRHCMITQEEKEEEEEEEEERRRRRRRRRGRSRRSSSKSRSRRSRSRRRGRLIIYKK